MLYHAIFAAFCCLIRVYVSAGETARIIIIGSGAAGIAAASRLLQNGFENVTILEAENRIGGRIHTTEFGKYWVDVGGQWVHGEVDNVAYELAWPLDLLEKSSGWNMRLVNSLGDPMDQERATKFMNFYIELTEGEAPDTYFNKSIGEYFKDRIDEYFEENPDIKEEEREPLKNMVDLFEMSHDAGDNWLEVSAGGLRQYIRCAGDEGINWKDRGYGTILDVLMKKIPNPDEELPVLNNTVLNAEVSQINYNVSRGITHVVTTDGNEYSAEHVIITPSLGVLKADYATLFNPPLPESKVTAIKGLAFGSVAKIYLYFPEPFWNAEQKERDVVGLYWRKEDSDEFSNDPTKSWMLGILSIVQVEHKPGLLCFWLAGPHAREMETVPEEQVFKQSKELLHRVMGKIYNITEPTAMLRSQWFQNKHFRGTYSFRSLATEASGATAEDLSDPITEQGNPILLFAGEATSPHYYSTVHGAIGSGWREADRLIKFYNDRNSKQGKTPAAS